MENYHAYLEQRAILNKINQKHGLNFKDEMLLDHIATITRAGEVLTVGELLNERQFGSQATIHKNLEFLVEEQFIDRKIISDDSRAKSLSLGKKGKARAKEIAKVIGSF